MHKQYTQHIHHQRSTSNKNQMFLFRHAKDDNCEERDCPMDIPTMALTRDEAQQQTGDSITTGPSNGGFLGTP